MKQGLIKNRHIENNVLFSKKIAIKIIGLTGTSLITGSCKLQFTVHINNNDNNKNKKFQEKKGKLITQREDNGTKYQQRGI